MDDFLPEVRADLESRSIPVVVLKTPLGDESWADLLHLELRDLGLGPSDLIVALPSWVDVTLEELRIPVPAPPDYPDCLQHLLHRRVWKSTLGGVQTTLADAKGGDQFFIKPAEGAKGFSGTIVTAPVDDMLNMLLDRSIFPNLGADLEVHCSEVVDMNSEYAVYVVDGVVRATCHYMCKRSTCRCKDGDRAMAGEPVVELDAAVVEDAIRLLAINEETQKLTGYRADFALIKRVAPDGGEWFETALVEVNDGYVSGRYEGMSSRDFADMIISRFASLQSTRR